MDNDRHGIRATGEYASSGGREFLCGRARDGVRLLCDDDPLPPGFEASLKPWVQGERVVPWRDVERHFRVRTTAAWRGHDFEVGIIVGDLANVVFVGRDINAAGGLPGLWRPGMYEVEGEVPVSELTDVVEQLEEIPLGR